MAPRRDKNGDLVFSKQDMEDLLNLVSGEGKPQNWICPGCGTLHPRWEWARATSDCAICKDLPSTEDLTGEHDETTPSYWKPKSIVFSWPPKE